MRIISPSAWREFCRKHPDARVPLDDWYRIAKRATWRNHAEVKQSFNSADVVGSCTCFNIGGNKYRLIVWINYDRQTIFVRWIMTHEVYDRKEWLYDCKK